MNDFNARIGEVYGSPFKLPRGGWGIQVYLTEQQEEAVQARHHAACERDVYDEDYLRGVPAVSFQKNGRERRLVITNSRHWNPQSDYLGNRYWKCEAGDRVLAKDGDERPAGTPTEPVEGQRPSPPAAAEGDRLPGRTKNHVQDEPRSQATPDEDTRAIDSLDDPDGWRELMGELRGRPIKHGDRWGMRAYPTERQQQLIWARDEAATTAGRHETDHLKELDAVSTDRRGNERHLTITGSGVDNFRYDMDGDLFCDCETAPRRARGRTPPPGVVRGQDRPTGGHEPALGTRAEPTRGY